MYIHEYGDPSLPALVLLHPMEVTGEELYALFSRHLAGRYHIISPDQGGHGSSGPYVSEFEEAGALRDWLVKRGYARIRLLYGASMGGCAAYELMKMPELRFEKVWIDGTGFAPDARFMNWMMREMFLRKLKSVRKDPSKPSANLIKMYGPDFEPMMRANFAKLSEADITNICRACSRRKLQKVSGAIHLEWGEKDPNLKSALPQVKTYLPTAEVVTRGGYGHCGYMAFHTREYVREMEAFINQEV